MPYAAGVYTVPPGTTATTLTAIDSTDYNAFVADIETAINSLTDGSVSWRAGLPAYAGTAALPGLTFSGDLDTGFYWIGANNIGLSLAGVKHGDFSTTGAQLLLKGAPTAGGTADALTVAWGIVPSALASGQRILFKAASANTGAATLNLNSLGAKAIRKISGGTDAALAAGDIAAGAFYEAVYDSAANAAAGGWIILTSNATTRSSLGLDTTDSPQFTAINLGHASDTTLSRSAAGIMAVEGNVIPSPASQASGDILYRGASSWSRLAKGTASQVLTMNAGATAPEWANASSSGQPVPTTSTLAVGSAAMLFNVSAGNIANGSTAAGTDLASCKITTEGITTAAGAQTGTWKNISGISLNNNVAGMWVRTA